MPSKSLTGPVAATALLAAARLSPLAPLRDAATGDFIAHARLEFPWGHLLLTPFSTLADLLTCNSLRQDAAFLGWAALFYVSWRLASKRPLGAWRRESLRLTLALCALVLFITWAVFFPRATARLVLRDADAVALDFHSHTSLSWDGLRHFTPERNERWHERAGYQGAFITDHHDRRAIAALGPGKPNRYSSLAGEEVGHSGSHILLLGSGRMPDSREFAQDLSGQKLFLGAAREAQVPAVMSLPEYWKRHWDGGLSRFADWGVQGFEIVSGSPKALDFPADKRRQVVALCRERGLFMSGGSDNHGYAQAPCVWNIMRIADWDQIESRQRERAVLETLKRERFNAVQVAVRTRQEPAPGPWIALDTPRALWTLLRVGDGAQTAALLLWIWFPFLLSRSRLFWD